MTLICNQYFKFLLASQGSLLNAIRMYDVMQHVRLIHSAPKEKLTKFRVHMHSRWLGALIPVVSSSGITYAIVVSIPAEEHK
jgi:hypothetical protein